VKDEIMGLQEEFTRFSCSCNAVLRGSTCPKLLLAPYHCTQFQSKKIKMSLDKMDHIQKSILDPLLHNMFLDYFFPE